MSEGGLNFGIVAGHLCDYFQNLVTFLEEVLDGVVGEFGEPLPVLLSDLSLSEEGTEGLDDDRVTEVGAFIGEDGLDAIQGKSRVCLDCLEDGILHDLFGKVRHHAVIIAE